MKSYAKPITKQLIIGAIILFFVTVASLGIRQVRFSRHRANAVESPIFADPEQNPTPVETDIVHNEPKPEYLYASDLDIEDEPEPQQATAPVSKKVTSSKTKPLKSKKVKSKKSKDLETIPLSENENLYRSKKGELWYVRQQPGGKTVKMQVYIDDATGEIAIVDAKSGGSKNTQKISLGDSETLYITEEGEQWYVSKQPDGSSSKSRALFDDTTGEITIIDDYSDTGEKRTAKD